MRPLLVVAALLLATAVGADAADGIQSIGSCQTIDKPGSYVLAKNLTARETCLVITASFVTVDLAGYTISGNGTGVGITNGGGGFDTTGVGPFEITIRNGTVTNFENGVHLDGRGHVVESIRAVNNVQIGIHLVSAPGMPGDGVLRNNVASRNGLVGLRAIQNGAGGGWSIVGNTANSNGPTAGGEGIIVTCPSAVLHNTATGNAANIVPQSGGCTLAENSPAP
jgi:hypothetical protein